MLNMNIGHNKTDTSQFSVGGSIFFVNLFLLEYFLYRPCHYLFPRMCIFNSILNWPMLVLLNDTLFEMFIWCTLWRLNAMDFLSFLLAQSENLFSSMFFALFSKASCDVNSVLFRSLFAVEIEDGLSQFVTLPFSESKNKNQCYQFF